MQKLITNAMAFLKSLVAELRPSLGNTGTVGSVGCSGTLGAKVIRGGAKK